MRHTTRRGGPGDWIAPLGALVVVVALGWAGVGALDYIGLPMPWTGGPGATAPVPGAQAPARGASDERSDDERSDDERSTGAGARERTPAGSTSLGGERAEMDTGVPAAVTPAAGRNSIEFLRSRRLTIPVPGIPGDAIVSNYHDARGDRTHEALDILAPHGQPVVAVDDGSVAKLFYSVRGGKTIYQFDPTGRFAYYYAHLDRYEEGLTEGANVRRGQVIGYVGTSGNAPPDTPHLHFAIYELGPERLWWKGAPVDPADVLRAP